MSPTTLRNKSLNLCTLFNIASLLFILPNTVLCIGVINGSNINGTKEEQKEEQRKETVDNTIVWISIGGMYLLFGLVLYLVVKFVIDRRRKNKARTKAIIDLEMGSDLKKDIYKEVTKPPPAIIPITKKNNYLSRGTSDVNR